MEMTLSPTWWDIGIRLVLTILASVALGVNRSAEGKAAGFRTTILVGLAAVVLMIQANILLSLEGKSPTSFAVMDPMRLALGVLTGVGFIGGGCILKRGELVTGVTTAATLWSITAIGLCFGGGQLALGIGASVLALLTLWILRWIDIRIPKNHRARIIIETDKELPLSDLEDLIGPLGYQAYFHVQTKEDDRKYIEFEIHWYKPENEVMSFQLLTLLEEHYNVRSFKIAGQNS